MKNTVLIFGAGASWDCIEGGGLKIPMSKSLYDVTEIGKINELQQALDSWTVVKNRAGSIQNIILNDFAGKTEEYLTAKMDDPLEVGFMLHSIYYLRQLTSVGEKIAEDANNYQKVFEWLLSQDKVHVSDVVNFNYDVICDTYFRNRYTINHDPLAYLSNKTRLIKPHGSSDWYVLLDIANTDKIKNYRDAIGRAAEKVNIGRDAILSANMSLANIQVADVSYFDDLLRGNSSLLPRPCLILPLLSKELTKSFPELEVAMKDAINKADHLILIGYKGADEDFVDVITDRLEVGNKKLVISVVGGESAVDIRNGLIRLGANGLAGFTFARGFSKFVNVLLGKHSKQAVSIVADGYLCVRDYDLVKDLFEQQIPRFISDTGLLLSKEFEASLNHEVTE